MRRKLSVYALQMLVSSFVLGAVLSAHAEPICIQMTGEVTSVESAGNSLDSAIHVGDALTAAYVYESTTPNTSTEPTLGSYPQTAAGTGLVFNINGYLFRTNPDDRQSLIAVRNDYSEYHEDYLLITSLGGVTDFDYGSTPSANLWVQLGDATGTALSDVALPTEPPNISDWTMADIVISHAGNQSSVDFTILGKITSFSFCGNVPPATVAICLKPGTAKEKTIYVREPAVSALLTKGGIALGACASDAVK